MEEPGPKAVGQSPQTLNLGETWVGDGASNFKKLWEMFWQGGRIGWPCYDWAGIPWRGCPAR